jgi:3-hydroxybutyryl-CoA dehydrogenase
VLAHAEQKEELLEQGLNSSAEVLWGIDPEAVNTSGVDGCIDLLFDNSQERIKKLLQLKPLITVINSVENTLEESDKGFIRINGWNTFLKRPVIEAAGKNDKRENAEQLFSCFNKKTEWLADLPGFISARVVAGIINEAWFALEEEVSSKEEIDIAMKLGTNYPYGPFEWCNKIGAKNIFNLLTRLAKEQKRYEPAALLTKEASV